MGLNDHMRHRVLKWEEEGPKGGEVLRMWVWLVSWESGQTSSPGRSGRAPALDPYSPAVRSP